MRVVVAEKPSVARDLARVLGAGNKRDGCFEGNGLRITWCIGHLVELEDPAHYDASWKKWSFDTLPMIPEQFALRLRQGIADHFKIVKALLRDKDVDSVINACDAGREGELIFRYVYDLAGCRKPTFRLWTSSLTDSAIQQAWSKLRPGADYDALADAARSRSEADWLVGLNATRALTCLARSVGGDQLLSVGRVQTPTLAMIVGRDEAIAAFVPEKYWQVKGTFEARDFRWDATYFQGTTDGPAVERDDDDAPKAERLGSAADAEAVAAAARGRPGTVTEADRRRTREQPPLLYDLTSLQRRANERYSFSADKTLAIAQALYEKHKLITYPRTDARYLTPDQIPELPRIVRGLAGLAVYKPFADAILAAPIQPGKRVVDAAEVGDHHAILPTGKTPDPERLDGDERRIFDLVARRLMAALSQDALFDVTTLVVSVPTDAPLPETVRSPLRFRARGRVCRQQGWRAVDPPGKGKELDLPPVDKGDPAAVVEAKVHEGATRPPRPFNDATLLRGMETAGRDLDDAELKRAMRHAGLGTPATRAEIIKTLVERKYIVRQARDLRATPTGVALIAAIPVAELKSAELTGRWEARLAAIAEQSDDRPRFMADVAEHLRGLIAAIRVATPPPAEVSAKAPTPVVGECPVCHTPVHEGRQAFSCETGRACAFVVFKTIAKRPVSTRMVKQLLTEGRTPVLKGFKNKAGKPFDAGLALGPDGKVTFWFPDRERSPVGMACPKCEGGRIVRGKKAWGCDRWREGCAFVLGFEAAGRALSDAEAVALLGR